MEYKFFEKCMSNLNTLGKLTQGQKLDVTHGYISIDTGSVSSVGRLWRRQGRELTIDEVSDCISAAIEFGVVLYEFLILAKTMRQEDISDAFTVTISQKNGMYEKLYDRLRGANDGISALMSTYNNDKSILTRYSGIKKDLDIFLNDHKLK